jgi:hypothetical protein
VHPNPPAALSDREQQLTMSQFDVLMREIALIAAAVGRGIAGRARDAGDRVAAWNGAPARAQRQPAMGAA